MIGEQQNTLVKSKRENKASIKADLLLYEGNFKYFQREIIYLKDTIMIKIFVTLNQ